MADRPNSDTSQPKDGAQGSFDLAHPHHAANWTDGLPHNFQGWGPQTPDPDDNVQLTLPEGDLVWRGKDGEDNVVWRFDMRRHHHN